MKRAVVLLSIVLLMTSYTFYRYSYAQGESMSMELMSTFAHNTRMPDKYTCKETKQKGISPELQWNNVPNGVQSFAIICQDPNAVGGTFTHWVLYNLPANLRHVPEGAFIEKITGAGQGFNSANKPGWFHACPPAGTGTHKYIFTLYALDTKLNLSGQVSANDLKKAMKDNIIAQAELIGLYSIE